MKTVTDFLEYIGYEYPDDRKRDDNPLWVLEIPIGQSKTRTYGHKLMSLENLSNLLLKNLE